MLFHVHICLFIKKYSVVVLGCAWYLNRSRIISSLVNMKHQISLGRNNSPKLYDGVSLGHLDVLDKDVEEMFLGMALSLWRVFPCC